MDKEIPRCQPATEVHVCSVANYLNLMWKPTLRWIRGCATADSALGWTDPLALYHTAVAQYMLGTIASPDKSLTMVMWI